MILSVWAAKHGKALQAMTPAGSEVGFDDAATMPGLIYPVHCTLAAPSSPVACRLVFKYS